MSVESEGTAPGPHGLGRDVIHALHNIASINKE